MPGEPIITRLTMQVESIKRVGPTTYEVRAIGLLPPEQGPVAQDNVDTRKILRGGSIFFYMTDLTKAPTIFQQIIVTVTEPLEIRDS